MRKPNIEEPSLLNATRDEEVEEVKRLLDKGVDPNVRHIWTTKTEEKAGRDVDLCPIAIRGTCPGINTPLHVAISMRNLQLVELLLAHGADVKLQDTQGNPALHLSIKSRVLELVDVVLSNGADVGVVDSRGSTALHLAVANGYLKMAEMLLGKGANVDANDANANTPLHIAVSRNYPQMVKFLLSHGAESNAKGAGEATPLHEAVEKGYLEAVEMLLEGGADVNAQDASLRTPLHRVIRQGFMTIFHLLLSHAIDVNIQDAANNTPLHLSIDSGYLEMTSHVLQKEPDVKVKGDGARTPLHLAACKGYAKIVAPLLEKGAEINAVDANENTPLHLAVASGHVVMVHQLLNQGADVLAKNSDGDSALHFAAASSANEVVPILLLQKGANRLLQNNKGEVPLELAVEKNKDQHAVIRELLGADENLVVTNTQNPTALEWAVAADKLNLVALLLSKTIELGRESEIDQNLLKLAKEHDNSKVTVEFLHEQFSQVKVEEPDPLALHRDHLSSPLVLNEPWRPGLDDFSPKRTTELQRYVADYAPSAATVAKRAKILLVGQIGAGKSSFFNTINSIFRGHVTAQAATGTDPASLTRNFRVYDIRSGRDGPPLNFVICDTMGLEEGAQGMEVTDFHFLLDGLVPDNFKFRPNERLSGEIEVANVIRHAEKVHVLVVVQDALEVDYINASVLPKIQDMCNSASRRAVAVLVILTKIDLVCPEVGDDLTTVYHSAAIRDCVNKTADLYKVDPAQVVPVRNYNTETELDQNVDILALNAMRQILKLADETFLDGASVVIGPDEKKQA